MIRKRLAASIALGALLLGPISGCGSDPKEKPGATGSSKSSATTKADANGLVAVTRSGVSLKVPAEWHISSDKDPELTVWVGREKKGSVGLSVRNSHSSAEEWVALLTGESGSLNNRVVSKEPMNVPGFGTGYHLVVRNQDGSTEDELVVASLDGVLVDVSVEPDPDHPERNAPILASVERKL